MSIREARLCDHEGCNNPASDACPLCRRDCCRAHLSPYYVAAAIMLGRPDQHASVTCVGRGQAISLCIGCQTTLSLHSKVLNFGGETPFCSLVAPLHDPLIEAVGAFLAGHKLKPTSG